MFSYFWPSTKAPDLPDLSETSVAVAESVTAGTLATSLCSEPGASSYFKGGVVAYSPSSKKEILQIDTMFAEENNFANPFTTMEMAKSIVKIFKARIGMATTGYSLPYTRPENKENHECALHIEHPYAYIALWDSFTGEEIIIREDFVYDPNMNKAVQRASVQAKIAIKGAALYKKHVNKIKGARDNDGK